MNDCICRSNFKNIWYGGDLFCVVTGANRGIGLVLAKQLIQEFTNPDKSISSLNLLLIARKKESLTEKIKAFHSKVHVEFKGTFNLLIDTNSCFDLAKLSEKEILKSFDALKSIESENLSRNSFYLFFHNAATLGEVKIPNHGYISIAKQNEYLQINFTSMTALNARFLELFIREKKSQLQLQNFIIVNLSSLAGQIPFDHMFQYCSIKAARDMYIKCLTKDLPDICAINFSPGPVKTEMWDELCKDNGSEESRKKCREMIEMNNVNTAEYSVSILLKWIKKLEFKEGKCIHNANVCKVHEDKFLDYSKGSYISVDFEKELK